MSDNMPSLPVQSLWAKTGSQDQSHLWEPLHVHLADTAEIMRILWREWASPHLKGIICPEEPSLGTDDMEELVCLIAGLHDIGKVHPAFQSKVPERWEVVQEAGFGAGGAGTYSRYLHAAAGEVLVEGCLRDLGLASEDAAASWASIIGNHHGVAPNTSVVNRIRSVERPYVSNQSNQWNVARHELVGWVATNVLSDEGRERIRNVVIAPYAQILIAGMLIMADWIASNQQLCPLIASLASWDEASLRAHVAYKRVNLPSIWQPKVPEDGDQLFHSRFPGIPTDAAMRPMQEMVERACRELESSSLLIIEDAMGNGKTEASLMAAEIMAERFGCSGLAYLLPTQATTDAMFDRIMPWLEESLAASGANPQTVRLMHGKAMLNSAYRNLVEQTAWLGDDNDRDELVAANAWLNGRKRGFLSPVVIGTVDQVLRAALCAKHVHLWHVGLANKVVVIDEVHAYDAYMDVYLDRVLSYLGKYSVPTILLSATLPESRRNEMIWAYRGLLSARARKKDAIPAPQRGNQGKLPYPLLTVAGGRKGACISYGICANEPIGSKVDVTFANESDALEFLYTDDFREHGGCVCVIRNTVRRAQETYQQLKEELGSDSVMLMHSRFLSSARARKNEQLLSMLGKDGQRPKRMVVVATQVVEQSLDVDFDLMVSDIAPVDLLLQRVGRLHRHERRNRPKRMERPRLVVTGADWEPQIPEFDRGIRAVYQDAILLRTVLAVRALPPCEDAGNAYCLSLPDDIPDLVHAVYDDGVAIPSEWEETMERADAKLTACMDDKRARAKACCLQSVPSDMNVTLDDWMRVAFQMPGEEQGASAVRDIQFSAVVSLCVPSAQDCEAGVEPWAWRDDPGLSDRDIGMEEYLAGDTVALPWCLARLSDQMLIDLSVNSFKQQGMQYPLTESGVLPLLLDETGRARVAMGDKLSYNVTYDDEMGLFVERQDDDE